MRTEKGALWLSAAVALVIGCVGLGFAVLTRSDAILLDGSFNLVYFVTALVTLKVARLVTQPDSEDYPFGFDYFEPLINGFKGFLILGLSMLALFDAVRAIFAGGRAIEVGPAIGYGAFATVTGVVTALLLRRVHRRTGSPLVGADASSWTVNAAVSGAVLLTFGAIPVISALGGDDVVPFVDPVLVTIVVVISLGVPIRMAWQALMAMLNRAPPAEFRSPVIAAIREALADLPSRSIYVRMIRPGRTLHAAVHVVLPADFADASLETFDAMRARVSADVQNLHNNAIVDVLFTADERWAAPASLVAADAAMEAA